MPMNKCIYSIGIDRVYSLSPHFFILAKAEENIDVRKRKTERELVARERIIKTSMEQSPYV